MTKSSDGLIRASIDRLLETGVSTVAAPVPKVAWRGIYNDLDALTDRVHRQPSLTTRITEAASQWHKNSGLSHHYSEYFKPYYRDYVGQKGRDQKVIFQFCIPFYKYLFENFSNILDIDEYRRVAEGSVSILATCQDQLIPFASLLGTVNTEYSSRLLQFNQGLPVAIRLIKYWPDASYLTNPHVDKTAFTVLLDSSDPADDRCIVVSSKQSMDDVSLSDFYTPASNADESVVMFGAAGVDSGYSDFWPAPHGVKPPTRPRFRYSAVFFWLLPDSDLSGYSTSIKYDDDLGLSRHLQP